MADTYPSKVFNGSFNNYYQSTQAETLYVDRWTNVVYSQPSDATGATCLNQYITPGYGDGQRIGSHIVITGLRCRFWKQEPVNYKVGIFRIAIVFDRQTNGAYPSGSLVEAAVFKRNGNVYMQSMLDPLDQSRADRFVLLFDKLYSVTNPAVVYPTFVDINLTDLHLPVEYTDAATGSIEAIKSGSLLFHAFAATNLANTVDNLSYAPRLMSGTYDVFYYDR